MHNTYSAGINQTLLNQIPPNCKIILEIGCGQGDFGAAVKAQLPTVTYFAVEINQQAANIAASKLDRVWCADVEIADLNFENIDCVIFNNTLSNYKDPLTLLKKISPILKSKGIVLFSIANIQHYSILENLLTSNFSYTENAILDKNHLRLFTYIGLFKLLLDASYIPELRFALTSPETQGFTDFFESLKPTLQYLKQDLGRSYTYLLSNQYIFMAEPNRKFAADQNLAFPITFIVPTNNNRILQENFLASPIFKSQHPHQIIVLENQTSAAQAIQNGLSQAQHDFIVYAHQDVYFPEKWDIHFTQRVKEAQAEIPQARLFGLYGSQLSDGKYQQHGHIVDRHWYRIDGGPLPQTVMSVDEFVFGFEKSKRSFSLDEGFGYHLYAADIAYQLAQQGLSTVAVDALCFHNCSLGLKGAYNEDYLERLRFFAQKWQPLPIVTPAIKPDEARRLLTDGDLSSF